MSEPAGEQDRATSPSVDEEMNEEMKHSMGVVHTYHPSHWEGKAEEWMRV